MKNNKQKTFYDLVSQDQQYKIAVGSASPKTIEKFNKIQQLLKFPLRPYQMEALSAFQLFDKDTVFITRNAGRGSKTSRFYFTSHKIRRYWCLDRGKLAGKASIVTADQSE